jgi:hypothetical protein
MFGSVGASAEDVARVLPGDDLVPDADVVMDRAFDLPAPPEVAWPWFAQLGKKRAGWYLPRSVERLLPPSRRGLRRLDAGLVAEPYVGHVIPDWGGRTATFEIAILEPPHVLVHTTRRGRTDGSWAIVLTPYAAGNRESDGDGTHVQLRLRLSPIKRPWLANTVGEAFDAATVAGLAAGLRERVSS